MGKKWKKMWLLKHKPEKAQKQWEETIQEAKMKIVEDKVEVKSGNRDESHYDLIPWSRSLNRNKIVNVAQEYGLEFDEENITKKDCIALIEEHETKIVIP